jgi:tryptophanyl-tRNA synthetase
MSSAPPAAYAGPTRVFSGVQPTANIHLGNYLGAIQRFVTLQDEMECIFCVVDLHAITVPQDPAGLAAQTREIAAAYLAAGIDPKRATVFVQSAVSAHAELAWVFNCVARMGWLERMTQFKDKAGKDAERASVGLFVYPNLMAADILAYKATHVPVGEDQKQHLELSRDIAQKFNNDFGVPGFFPLPEPLIGGPAARVMNLQDGTKKMSKSDPAELSRINLSDDADAIARKIKRARTDPDPIPETVDGLAGRPEVDNLVGIYAALDGVTKADVVTRFAGKGFGAFKPALADLAVAKLSPITEAMRRYMADPAGLDAVLRDGAERANAVAAPILAEVKAAVGFWR